MFGLGFSEILVLGLIALVVIGPDELPKVARTLGRLMNEVKRGGDTFKRELEDSARAYEESLKIKPLEAPPEPKANDQEKPLEVCAQPKDESGDKPS